MAERTNHNLEFAVNDAGGNQRTFTTFAEACGFAVGLAASTGKEWHIDVLVWNETAALVWGGVDGVARYKEDPDASVFDRFVIKADCIGSVP